MLRHNFIKQEVPTDSIVEYKVDASFRKIVKNATNFSIWKVDEDRLEAVPKPKYGTFYDDGAYIVYAAGPSNTYINQDTIIREYKTPVYLERFIHIWLGNHVTDQKRANVAHKIQELDSYLDNVATEYRETQNNESARFLSYFKRGLIIRSSALIDSKAPERLFQLYGRKYLRCTEMANISWEHFGSDYVMVLQTDEFVYIWYGRASSNIERRNAIIMASKLQTNPGCIILVDDGYEQQLPEQHKIIWNSFLPLNQRTVNQMIIETENVPIHKLKIYKCGYKGQLLHLDQLDVVIPTKEDLKDSTTSYVLDSCSKGVWLWVGSEASQVNSISAMGNGRAFVKKKKYPYSTPVIRVVAGHEPVEFIRLFPNWFPDNHETPGGHKQLPTICGKIDAQLLCQRPKMAAETQLADDGSGEKIIYCFTKDNKAIEMPTKKPIVFSTDLCYVIRYDVVCPSANPTDANNIGIKHIIYQWNGSEANAANMAKCEIFAKRLFDKLDEKSMFVQMCEFDETPHFLKIFDGKLIIMQSDENMQRVQTNNNNNSNGHGSINNNTINNNDNNNGSISTTSFEQKNFILRIQGDATYNSKAVEVYPLSSMSSKDCYVIKTNHIWVWCGQCATGDAREVAKSFGTLFGESTLIIEGMEPKEFWNSMANQRNMQILQKGSTCSSMDSSLSNGSDNSKLSHASSNVCYLTSNVKPRPKSQLFLVWLKRDKFCSQEIIGFDQNDLSPEGIFILDNGLITYVWLGDFAPPNERDNCLKIGQAYLETVPIARRPTTAMAIVKQDNEPNVFTGLFENWSHAYWKDFESFHKKRQEIAQLAGISCNTNGLSPISNGKLNGTNGTSPIPPSLLNNQYNNNFDQHHKYPISVLQSETDQLPAEVDPIKREVHLTHDDFVFLFHMSYWEFIELPGWKQQELKKKNKIF